MAYRWHYEDASGVAIDGPDGPGGTFDDRDEAETWLGEHWAVLLDAGVDQVTLVDGQERVLGPMSLHPPQP